MKELYKKVKCSKCGKEVEKIELFPQNQCLECYEKTPESKKEYSNDLLLKAIKI